MKKILLIIFTLFSVISYSQVIGRAALPKGDTTGELFYWNQTTGKMVPTLTNKASWNPTTSKLTLGGDLAYAFIHAVGSADSCVAYSVTGTQNVRYNIQPTGGTSGGMLWHEIDGITTVASSTTFTIVTAGEYEIFAWIAATTSQANDWLRVWLYTDGVANVTSLGRWQLQSSGSGNYRTNAYMWYKTFTAGQNVSFYIANLSATRAITISDIKVYIRKVPE